MRSSDVILDVFPVKGDTTHLRDIRADSSDDPVSWGNYLSRETCKDIRWRPGTYNLTSEHICFAEKC